MNDFSTFEIELQYPELDAASVLPKPGLKKGSTQVCYYTEFRDDLDGYDQVILRSVTVVDEL